MYITVHIYVYIYAYIRINIIWYILQYLIHIIIMYLYIPLHSIPPFIDELSPLDSKKQIRQVTTTRGSCFWRHSKTREHGKRWRFGNGENMGCDDLSRNVNFSMGIKGCSVFCPDFRGICVETKVFLLKAEGILKISCFFCDWRLEMLWIWIYVEAWQVIA